MAGKTASKELGKSGESAASTLGAAGLIRKRAKYNQYNANVQSAGKEPLPFEAWIKAGEPEG